MMDIPTSLMVGVSKIEKELLHTEMEALVVPLRDIDRFHHATRRILSRKVKPHVASSRKKPLVTIGVADCNALVLISEGGFALFHEHSNINPKSYLPRFLSKLKSEREGDLSDVKAIQVAGDDNTFSRIGEILDGYGIPVVESYRDGWNIGRKVCIDDLSKIGHKHIFVFPKQRHVVMYRMVHESTSDEIINYPEEVILYEE
jgi:hypothetical protein